MRRGGGGGWFSKPYVLRKNFDGFLCVKGLAPVRGRENFGGGFACVLTEIRIRTPYFFGSRNENSDFSGFCE